MQLPTRNYPAFCCLALGLLLAAGCSIESFDDEARQFRQNSPPPPDPAPDPGPDPTPDPAAFNPVFSEVQANVFTPSCASVGCHDSGAAAGLNLTAGTSYAMLVDIPSTQDGDIVRVAPNDPDASYLIQKLEGTAATGQQMPPGGALSQPVIDVVRQWITDGAIDDTATPPPAPVPPIRVSSIAPQPSATLDAAPGQIVAGFSRELDATSVNAMTFVLEASGGDASFTDGNEVTIAAAAISVPNTNRQSAIYDLTGVVLADDRYRVTLAGGGASMIMDLDANALDGEFTGVFPSGNGTAGGDFESFFTISTPVVLGPTLDQIQSVVFTPSCATAGCHTGPAGNMLPAGLDLSDADASFASLVNIASNQSAGATLVVPTDPDSSYLIQKLEAAAAVGNVMPPPPRAPLDAATIGVIRQWITDGALR